MDQRTNIDVLATSNGSPVAGAAPTCALAVVDGSRLRRECLGLAFGHHHPHWRVSEFGTAAELARSMALGAAVDLVLIGAATCEHLDLAELEAIRDALPGAPVVVVAENGSPHRAQEILDAGARGVLPTSLSLKAMMGAVELLLRGNTHPSSPIDDEPRTLDAWSVMEQPGEPWSELTRRQRDVLALISHGKSNKLIAEALAMSESTVKAHVKQIIRRLHVANRTQAALLATGHGPFAPPPLNGSPAVGEVMAK